MCTVEHTGLRNHQTLCMPTSGQGTTWFNLYVVYSCDVVTQVPRDTMANVICCQLLIEQN